MTDVESYLVAVSKLPKGGLKSTIKACNELRRRFGYRELSSEEPKDLPSHSAF